MTTVRRRGIDAGVAARLRAARERKGWTQADLAAWITQETGAEMDLDGVGRIERGARPLRFTEAVAAARGLDVGLYWLAGQPRRERAGRAA